MIEFPHLMQALMAVIALGSIVTTVVMTRGKAAADKVTELERKLEAKGAELGVALADKASAGRMGALEDRVDKVEDRTTSIEGELRHLPSRDQTHSMEISLQKMEGQLAVLTEKIGPIAATNQRLQEYLLEEARSKREVA